MPDIIEVLAKSNSPALMAAIVGIVMVLFSREYFKAVIRLRELRQKREQIETEKTAASDTSVSISTESEKPSAVVDFNFRLLEKYYEQHLVEYRLMARASLVIAILGFLVIVIGVFFTFANQVSVGVISSIAGLVAEAAAVMFFRQNNLLIEQIREYHKKLVSTQYLLTSITIL